MRHPSRPIVGMLSLLSACLSVVAVERYDAFLLAPGLLFGTLVLAPMALSHRYWYIKVPMLVAATTCLYAGSFIISFWAIGYVPTILDLQPFPAITIGAIAAAIVLLSSKVLLGIQVGIKLLLGAVAIGAIAAWLLTASSSFWGISSWPILATGIVVFNIGLGQVCYANSSKQKGV